MGAVKNVLILCDEIDAATNRETRVTLFRELAAIPGVGGYVGAVGWLRQARKARAKAASFDAEYPERDNN